MSELLMAERGGLISAGVGSRLLEGLIAHDEVFFDSAANIHRFTETGDPYEKGFVSLVRPDQTVEDDEGVVVLDLAVKDFLCIPDLNTIDFLINPNSRAPKRYKTRIERNVFLGRLGLPQVEGPNVSPFITCNYRVQQPKSSKNKRYGTAHAIDLVSDGVVLGENELMMITETDSAFLYPGGESMPAKLLQGMRGNPRGATVGLGLSRMTDDVTRQNGLGMVLTEQDGDHRYFDLVIESEGHADLAQIAASGRQLWKNTSRYAVDAAFLATNRQTMRNKPSAISKFEYQATDTVNAHRTRHPIYALTTPKGVIWVDMGRIGGVLFMREALSGLRNAEKPEWPLDLAA